MVSSGSLKDFFTTVKNDPVKKKHLIGLMAFTLGYPLLESVIRYIPNPMVPGGIVALNMILPVLAGYFFGPWSGAVAGGAGTGIAGLFNGSVFNTLAIVPHAIMGAVAGWTGKYHSKYLSALTILIGHSLNMLFYLGSGVLTIPAGKAGASILGLATESMVDIVAIVLVIVLLDRYLFCTERW